jgi:hypothetical protein
MASDHILTVNLPIRVRILDRQVEVPACSDPNESRRLFAQTRDRTLPKLQATTFLAMLCTCLPWLIRAQNVKDDIRSFLDDLQ